MTKPKLIDLYHGDPALHHEHSLAQRRLHDEWRRLIDTTANLPHQLQAAARHRISELGRTMLPSTRVLSRQPFVTLAVCLVAGMWMGRRLRGGPSRPFRIPPQPGENPPRFASSFEPESKDSFMKHIGRTMLKGASGMAGSWALHNWVRPSLSRYIKREEARMG